MGLAGDPADLSKARDDAASTAAAANQAWTAGTCNANPDMIPDSSCLTTRVGAAPEVSSRLMGPDVSVTLPLPKGLNGASEENLQFPVQADQPAEAGQRLDAQADLLPKHDGRDVRIAGTTPAQLRLLLANDHTDARPSSKAQQVIGSNDHPAGPTFPSLQGPCNVPAAHHANGTLPEDTSFEEEILADQPGPSAAGYSGQPVHSLHAASNENTSAAANVGGPAGTQQLQEKLLVQLTGHHPKQAPGELSAAPSFDGMDMCNGEVAAHIDANKLAVGDVSLPASPGLDAEAGQSQTLLSAQSPNAPRHQGWREAATSGNMSERPLSKSLETLALETELLDAVVSYTDGRLVCDLEAVHASLIKKLRQHLHQLDRRRVVDDALSLLQAAA
ncbi:hypothetical protein WJX74_006616 [Apatococcus lobatus]|uniref:Uncharacterized protein n=1 Tax=Apatococcus lobatus TaxID=904363 RepID=A0AAW1RT51_9CHLO